MQVEQTSAFLAELPYRLAGNGSHRLLAPRLPVVHSDEKIIRHHDKVAMQLERLMGLLLFYEDRRKLIWRPLSRSTATCSRAFVEIDQSNLFRADFQGHLQPGRS